MSHSNLPWSTIRHAYRQFRRSLFTKPKPEDRPFVVKAEKAWLVHLLGQNGYAPNWEFSYNYRGEDVNLARIVHERNRNIEWWQVHVRGWVQDNGTIELRPHWEPEPTEHPKPHLNAVGHNVARGRELLGGLLDDTNVTIEEDPR